MEVNSARRLGQFRVLPLICFAGGTTPIDRQFQPCIIKLAIAQSIKYNGPGGGLPFFCTSKQQLTGGGTSDFKSEFRVITPRGFLKIPNIIWSTVVPAVSKNNSYSIDPELNEPGEIIHGIIDMLIIAAYNWIEQAGTYFFTVAVKLIKSETANRTLTRNTSGQFKIRFVP